MSTGSPRTASLWVAAGAGVSGVATYLFLVVAARALGPASYGDLSLFWAAIVISSLGAFLPMEQVIARRVAVLQGPGERGLLRTGVRLGGATAVLAVVVHSALWIASGPAVGARSTVTVLLAFGVAAAGFAVQFPARGALAGRHALREYAVVVSTDAVLRAGGAAALWLAGVTDVGAYAAVVGLSALTCGLVGLVLVRRTRGAQAPARAVVPGVRDLARDVLPLVVAMLCMQGLLNSSLLVAGTADRASDAVLAGHLLAIVTLARLPVFLMQAAQAGYVARIASFAHLRDEARLRRLLLLIAAGVVALGAATVVVAVGLGPVLVRVLFGSGYDITRTAAALVSVGVALYLVASVANDVTVALGVHHRGWRAWTVGAGAGAVLAFFVPDVLLRSTLPLLVGSLVAAGVLVPVVLRRAKESSW